MNVKKQRAKLGISQLHLAKEARLSRYRIQMHESGYRSLRHHELLRVKAALNKIRSELESVYGVQLSLEVGGQP